jgi:hypothetical protein
MERGRLSYSVGNENNPGNPFGRSDLAIATDGSARLEHTARGGAKRAWTGRVAASALDRLWAALGRSGFPAVPQHPIPGGATMRVLTIEPGGGAKQGAYVEWSAAAKLPGYDEAFALLDAVEHLLSGRSVARVKSVADDAVVTDVTPV